MTTDLARRLVACPRWRWVEGMRIASPPELAGLRVAPGSVVSPHALPDLDDPATVGCLLALVREAYNRPDLHTCPMFSLRTGDLVRWRVALDEHMAHYGPTEAAALVAALEAT